MRSWGEQQGDPGQALSHLRPSVCSVLWLGGLYLTKSRTGTALPKRIMTPSPPPKHVCMARVTTTKAKMALPLGFLCSEELELPR